MKSIVIIINRYNNKTKNSIMKHHLNLNSKILNLTFRLIIQVNNNWTDSFKPASLLKRLSSLKKNRGKLIDIVNSKRCISKSEKKKLRIRRKGCSRSYYKCKKILINPKTIKEQHTKVTFLHHHTIWCSNSTISTILNNSNSNRW